MIQFFGQSPPTCTVSATTLPDSEGGQGLQKACKHILHIIMQNTTAAMETLTSILLPPHFAHSCEVFFSLSLFFFHPRHDYQQPYTLPLSLSLSLCPTLS